jgi:hypothetical protein
VKHKTSESEGHGYDSQDSYDEDDDDGEYSGADDVIEIRIASNIDHHHREAPKSEQSNKKPSKMLLQV